MEVSGTDLVRYVVTDFQKNKHIGTNCASLANIVIWTPKGFPSGSEKPVNQ